MKVIRIALVFVFSSIAAYGMYALDSSPPIAIKAISLLLVSTTLFMASRRLGFQIAARAIWWQAAMLGVLAAIDLTMMKAAPLLVGGFGAILVAGKLGFSNDSTFAPVAFRWTLLTAMIFGLADLSALLLYGSLTLEGVMTTQFWSSSYADVAVFFGSAAVMAVSVFGLYRMKVWGLVACILANIAIAGFAITGIFDLPDILAYGLCATAIAQLVIPMPLVARMVRSTKIAA